MPAALVIFIMLLLCTVGCSMQVVQALYFRQCRSALAWTGIGLLSAFFMVLFGLKAFVWAL